MLAVCDAKAAGCDDPVTSDEVLQCLGIELREADAKINSTYQTLLGKLSENDRTALRSAQRGWIKGRDSVCELDTKEKDRERWYRALLKDYVKTVCVTRYTRQRTSELDAMLARVSRPQEATAPVAQAAPPAAAVPAKGPSNVHSNGKWYYEVTINYAEVVRVEPTVMTTGVSAKRALTGILDNVRARDANKDIQRYGFAVDLDNGKLYISRNGAWPDGEPGSNRGLDLKLGRDYYAVFITSSDKLHLYVERKAVILNFGGTAMTYALPAGYSPWWNRTRD